MKIPQMIQIAAGTFTIGLDRRQAYYLAQGSDLARRWLEKGYFQREQPAHELFVPDFAIGKNPVTVAEYRPFVVAGGYRERRYWTIAGWSWLGSGGRKQPRYWNDPEWSGNETLPMVGVNYFEAMAYCLWLSDGCDNIFRLPTETEWEYAARGTDGRLYPWGDDFDQSRCNMAFNNRACIAPVDRFSPEGDSPWGVSGMAGNVSEWTASLFRPYPYESGADRVDPEGVGPRVTRGGSWHSNPLRVRSTSRGYNDPTFCDNDLGFRMVFVKEGRS